MKMELLSLNFIILILSFLSGSCFAQRRRPSTILDCLVNSCSYSRDTRAMDCEGRQLICVPSNDLYKQSDSVKLAQNTISRIKQTSFAGYSRLTQLDLSNNLISALDPNAFGVVSTLRTLLVNFNQLSEIGATAFSNLRSLLILQLQGNVINSIHRDAFKDLVSIRELNLAGNRLTYLPDGVFSAMSAMQMLFLQENQLILSADSQFLRGLRGLQDIDLDGNRFSAIPRLDDLSRLTALDMTDSHVTVLLNNTFRNTARLRDVVLSGNIISTIEPAAFAGLRNAVELDLSNNAIVHIPVYAMSPLRNLEVLLLQNNLMTSLRSEHFAYLTSLRTMNLEGNQLRRLPLMTSLHSLTFLNAKSNLLETFDQPTLRSLPRVNKLQLVGNKLQCDCRLKALKQWFIASGPAHHPYEIPHCRAARPATLRGKRVTAVSHGDLVCEAPVVRSEVRLVHKTSGASLRLYCISNGFPTPRITWRVPGGIVYTAEAAGRITVTEDGELVFQTVEPRDEGEYICLGTNPAGRSSASITLRVTPVSETPIANSPTAPPNPPIRQTSAHAVPAVNVTSRPAVARPVTVNPAPTTKGTAVVFPNPTTVTELSQTPSSALATIDAGSHGNHSNTGRNDGDLAERDQFWGSNVPPLSTDSWTIDENDVKPVCFLGYSGGGLFVAILCTFFLTIAIVIGAIIAWKKGYIPSGSKVNDQKERLVNMICRRDIGDGEEQHRASSTVSSHPRIRDIHPPSTARSSRQSYDRMEDSSLGSSYSFSEVSTESVSVSSREETARYVTTESVLDPLNVRMRQQRLAAIANSVAHSSLSESDISSSNYMPRQDSSQRRVYANAAMEAQDPNYTSLWRQGDSNQPPNYERARKVDSRIYIDVR